MNTFVQVLFVYQINYSTCTGKTDHRKNTKKHDELRIRNDTTKYF